MKKYNGCLIVLLLILVPRTNSKYVLKDDKIVKVNSPKFNINEYTNGPLEIKDYNNEYLNLRIINNGDSTVKGEVIIDGTKIKDVVVASNKEEVYKIYLTSSLYQKLEECLTYTIKINYTAPYKVSRNLTTIKKASTSLFGRIKCMNLGNDSEKGIDYARANSSSNGEGVYLLDETKYDTNPVYFFRGTHNLNNNIIFSGFCWKIIRTTETGGVRVVYNGRPSSGRCNTTIGSSTQIGTSIFNVSQYNKKYVGYMYGSDSNPYNNTYDSEMKKYIDNWYTNNIRYTSDVNKLDTRAIYCNDRTEDAEGRGAFSYGGDVRYRSHSPSVKCSLNDSFSVNGGNRRLQYPVGLLTIDENMLAGFEGEIGNTNYYLHTGQKYALLSPGRGSDGYGYSHMININDDGKFFGDFPNGTFGVRPVITIKGDTTVISGNGIQNNPFTV